MGNDNHAFYPIWLETFDLKADPQFGYNAEGIVCSSPAISYSADAQHNRWIYVVSRKALLEYPAGTLLAFKTQR